MNPATAPQPPWQHCPYLGLHDDSSTSLAYASPWNYCYRCDPPGSVLASHQSEVCLGLGYMNCAVYRSNTLGRLPRPLRGRGRTAKLPKPIPMRLIRLVELVLLAAILTLLLVYGQHILP